jgi:hypothetical protein
MSEDHLPTACPLAGRSTYWGRIRAAHTVHPLHHSELFIHASLDNTVRCLGDVCFLGLNNWGKMVREKLFPQPQHLRTTTDICCINLHYQLACLLDSVAYLVAWTQPSPLAILFSIWRAGLSKPAEPTGTNTNTLKWVTLLLITVLHQMATSGGQGQLS